MVRFQNLSKKMVINGKIDNNLLIKRNHIINIVEVNTMKIIRENNNIINNNNKEIIIWILKINNSRIDRHNHNFNNSLKKIKMIHDKAM